MEFEERKRGDAELQGLRLLVESVKDYAIFMLEPDGTVVTWNAGAQHIKGYAAQEIVGRHFSIFYPEEEREKKSKLALEIAAATGRSEDEGWRVRKDGTRFWANAVITAIRDEKGELVGFSKVTRDLTERKQAEQERLRIMREQIALEERRRENERSSFLADVSTILSSSLDYHKTLKELARLSVPALADWCTVTILGEDGKKERVAIVHCDESKAALIEELNQRYPTQESEEAGIGYVIKSGRSVFTPLVYESDLQSAARDGRHFEIMRELDCRSCIVAPISARGKTLGAVSFVSGKHGRVYDEDDLWVAEELGRRAGVAIDNAFLFQQAQKAVRARDEFLSIASHELKTPLTSLKLQTQLRIREVSRGDFRRFSPEKLPGVFAHDEKQINRLVQLVEDLLDVSRVQSGKMSYISESFDINDLIQETLARMAPQFEVHGTNVSFEPAGPVVGQWDRFRIEQVLVNLLVNALRYGGGSPIEVRAGTHGDWAEFSVRDQGIGIGKEDQGRIFDQFERGETTKPAKGLGLGLYISRQIVEAHGGRIWVESEVGQGALFRVVLPFKAKSDQLCRLIPDSPRAQHRG